MKFTNKTVSSNSVKTLKLVVANLFVSAVILLSLTGCSSHPDSEACKKGIDAHSKMAYALADFVKSDDAEITDDVLAKFIVLSANLNAVESDTPEIQSAFKTVAGQIFDLLYAYSDWKLEKNKSDKAELRTNLEELMAQSQATAQYIDVLCGKK